MYKIIVILIILLIWFLYKPIELFANPQTYIFGSYKPKIIIISGVHGNEQAGPYTLEKLIKQNYFDKLSDTIKSTIIVIPRVNENGLKKNIRFQNNFWHPDINRNFTSEGGTEFISNFLSNITKNANLVIDFHEGWGYHKITPTSIGSTISPTNTPLAIMLSQQMLKNVNKTISINNKKFTLLKNEECTILSTLSCFLKHNNYILIETTGQNNIQPITIREEQIMAILNVLYNLRKLN